MNGPDLKLKVIVVVCSVCCHCAEDVDPSVGRFRNLVSQSVVIGPSKVGLSLLCFVFMASDTCMSVCNQVCQLWSLFGGQFQKCIARENDTQFHGMVRSTRHTNSQNVVSRS